MTRTLVTLDLDHTLWNPDEALQRAELASHAWLAQVVPLFGERFPLPQFVQWRVDLREQQPDLKHRVSEIRRVAFRTALEQSGLATANAHTLAEQAFDVFWRLRQEVAMFEGSHALLENLAKMYTLGALSNGNACLTTIGLAPFFAFHFAAENFPAAKPAPDLFLAALAKTGTAPDNSVHIGDHPVDDIQGAKNVGMKTLWVNLDNREWPAHLPPADANVSTLSAIPAAVQSLVR